MKYPVRIALAVLLMTVLLSAQTNTWTHVTSSELGGWDYPGMVYSPAANEFILSMGNHGTVYTVTVFTNALGKWINALPNDTLYGSAGTLDSIDAAHGKWADSTGYAYGNGRGQNGPFGWPWYFQAVNGYLRPNPNSDVSTAAYKHFCLNTDDGKIYYFINNLTFTYDPSTRLWDTLPVHVHPNGNAPREDGHGTGEVLKWSSMCYDPHNEEVVLFGGGGLDKPQGSPGGTWIYSPAARTWTKLNLDLEPGPRAHSPMVYDPVNHCIVLFGGDHLDYLLNDTWVYDCITRTWSKKNPSVRPRARAGHALLYMPKSGKIVLMGGYRYAADQSNEFEMWRYDVVADNWALIKRFGSETWPKLQVGFPAFGGVVDVDQGDTVVALGDSTLYRFVPHTYRMACDPTVTDNNGTAAYGDTRDTIAIRGGATEPSYWTSQPVQDTGAHETGLRNLALGVWTKITPPATPAGDRTWGTTLIDPEHDCLIKWGGGHAAYCGTDWPVYSIHNNRWAIGYRPEWPLEYNARNEPSPGPFTFNDRPFMPTHPVKCYAYDVNVHRVLVVDLLYTHVFDPITMDFNNSQRIPATAPSRGSQATYRNGLCATPHGAYNLACDQSYLFSADSMRWRKLPQTGTLPCYYPDCAGLVYDSKRDRIVYAAVGYSDMVNPAKLYEYRFSDGVAQQLLPADSSLATGTNMYREGVYLPNQDVILFQAHKSNGNLAYDCAANRWVVAATSGFAQGMDDVGTALAYDAKRNVVWLATNNCGLYALRTDSGLTRSELGLEAAAPESLCIAPNPFNPSTSITLPHHQANLTSGLSLRVFTLDGRCVADLSQRAVNAKKVEWLAANQPSGIYLVKFTAGKRTWERKAILIR